MGSVIWFIVVGYFIYKAVRKRNMQDGSSGRTPERMQTNTAPAQQIPIPMRTNRNTGRAGQQIGQAGQTGQTGQIRQTKPEQQRQQENQGSTMAYLEEKARQDAIEHAKEKHEEAKRLYQNSGGLRAAERLYEGDSVPTGKRCIVCGYCGAENLVPVIMRDRYSCYFCREPIQ